MAPESAIFWQADGDHLMQVCKHSILVSCIPKGNSDAPDDDTGFRNAKGQSMAVSYLWNFCNEWLQCRTRCAAPYCLGPILVAHSEWVHKAHSLHIWSKPRSTEHSNDNMDNALPAKHSICCTSTAVKTTDLRLWWPHQYGIVTAMQCL